MPIVPDQTIVMAAGAAITTEEAAAAITAMKMRAECADQEANTIATETALATRDRRPIPPALAIPARFIALAGELRSETHAAESMMIVIRAALETVIVMTKIVVHTPVRTYLPTAKPAPDRTAQGRMQMSIQRAAAASATGILDP